MWDILKIIFNTYIKYKFNGVFIFLLFLVKSDSPTHGRWEKQL